MEPYLQRGNVDEILIAKKEYRRLYKAKWKKERRKKFHEVRIQMTPDEYKDLVRESKRHGLPVSVFIRQSAISYMNKTYMLPKDENLAKILQLLKMMMIHVEDMCDSDDRRPLDGFLLAIQKLEMDIRHTYLVPLDLHTAIEKMVKSNTQCKQMLHHFIETL